MKKQKDLEKITPRLAETESGAPDENYGMYSFGGDDGFDPEDAEFDPEFASREGKGGGRKKNRKSKLEEHLRLLHVYFKDLEHETSLLSPQEELRIAANIKKCENKAEAIRLVLSEISRETSERRSGLKKYPA
jgi:hypothetical protein